MRRKVIVSFSSCFGGGAYPVINSQNFWSQTWYSFNAPKLDQNCCWSVLNSQEVPHFCAPTPNKNVGRFSCTIRQLWFTRVVLKLFSILQSSWKTRKGDGFAKSPHIFSLKICLPTWALSTIFIRTLVFEGYRKSWLQSINMGSVMLLFLRMPALL